ncbi:MAG: 4Fe-4S binding protein [Gammaproteobacteria bacterium SHHR-1]
MNEQQVTVNPPETDDNRPGRAWRWDITATPALAWMLRKPWPLTGLRLLVLGLLLLGIGHGLTQPDSKTGLTLLLFWGLFWPLLTVMVTPSFGNLFCAICPHGFIGRWLSPVGLKRRFPKALRGGMIGLSILVFGYWFIHYSMPGQLERSTQVTAWYFQGRLSRSPLCCRPCSICTATPATASTTSSTQ